jgi:tRNA uridine 5-carboxymethylaminomethyl modification enzyme
MFTSRAEYRLTLRQDNADIRLSALGGEIGLLPSRNVQKLRAKLEAIEVEHIRLAQNRVGTDTLEQMLRRPEVRHRDLPSAGPQLDEEIIQQVEINVKYAGYIERQDLEVARFRSLEDKQIPASFDYAVVHSLRTEARQKLSKIRPATIGQASRISGVSPSDIGVIMVWLKRGAAPTIAPATPGCGASEHIEQSGAGDCCGDL